MSPAVQADIDDSLSRLNGLSPDDLAFRLEDLGRIYRAPKVLDVLKGYLTHENKTVANGAWLGLYYHRDNPEIADILHAHIGK